MARSHGRLVQQFVDVDQFHAWITLEVMGEELADEFHSVTERC
jgi:hypothetical protein